MVDSIDHQERRRIYNSDDLYRVASKQLELRYESINLNTDHATFKHEQTKEQERRISEVSQEHLEQLKNAEKVKYIHYGLITCSVIVGVTSIFTAGLPAVVATALPWLSGTLGIAQSVNSVASLCLDQSKEQKQATLFTLQQEAAESKRAMRATLEVTKQENQGLNLAYKDQRSSIESEHEAIVSVLRK